MSGIVGHRGLLLGGGAVSYQAFVAAKSPLVYLRLKEASGNFTDSSGNGRHGVVTGSIARELAGVFATGDGSVEFVSANSAYAAIPNPHGNAAFNVAHTIIWRGRVTSLAARCDLFGYPGMRTYVTTDGRLQFDWVSPNYGGSSGTGTSGPGIVSVGENVMIAWAFTSNGSGLAGKLSKNGGSHVASLSSIAHLNGGAAWLGRGAGYGSAVVEGLEWYSGDLSGELAAHYAAVTA